MVALSTYLGHAKVADTYWYLEAVPELMIDIADRCGQTSDIFRCPQLLLAGNDAVAVLNESAIS